MGYKNTGRHPSGTFFLPNSCCRNPNEVNFVVLPYYSIWCVCSKIADLIGASSTASSVTDSAGVLAWKMSMRSGLVLLEKEQTPLKNYCFKFS